MRVIGHRGACGYAPENTLASFELAIQLDVDMIELDTQPLQSGELVVMHDETVDATTDGTGRVADFTLERWRQLDAGDGLPPPLLSEVLDLVDKRKPVNAEMKACNVAPALAELLGHYIENKGWTSDLLAVSSGNLKELRRFTQLMPQVQAGAVYGNWPRHFVEFADAHHMAFATLNAEFINAGQVRRAHEHGLEVRVFTINDALQALRMERLGVDAIFSNYPDRVPHDVGRTAIEKIQPARAQ